MSLFRRDRTGADTTLTMLRDVVEIVAIVAAGIWAFYVFVYENRIKPAMLQPDVTISGSLQRTGTVHRLEAIRAVVTANNVGTTAVKFLAYSITVVGSRVVATQVPWRPTHTPYADFFARHYRIVAQTPVFRSASLTTDADPRSQAGLTIQPGASSTSENVFYVPAGTYDRLTSIVVARIQRRDDPSAKTTLMIGPDGVPVIGGQNRAPDGVDNDRVAIATLSLSDR